MGICIDFVPFHLPAMSIIYMRLSKEKHSRLGTKQASFCEICLGYFQATNFSPNKTIFISIEISWNIRLHTLHALKNESMAIKSESY